MKNLILIATLAIPPLLAFCQPQRSPSARAASETQWMKDSLQLTPEQLNKATPLNLRFEQDMDNAAHAPSRAKDQEKLMRDKDKGMKTILSKAQYSRYLKREKRIRKARAAKYPPNRQPL